MPTPLPIPGRPFASRSWAWARYPSSCSRRTRAGRRRDRRRCAISTQALPNVGRARFPDAMLTTELDELLAVDADVVDVLVPTPAHGPVATRILDAGLPRAGAEADRPLDRRRRRDDRGGRPRGATLRVLEDYLFYPPLVQLRDMVASGEIGAPTGVHMKIVGTGRGGWDIPDESYPLAVRAGPGRPRHARVRPRLASARGRGLALRSDAAHVRLDREHAGRARDRAGHHVDTPSTLVWEHDNGVRGVLDITLAPDTYFRSDYYSVRRAGRGHGNARLRALQPRELVRNPRALGRGVPRGRERGYHRCPTRRRTRSRRPPRISSTCSRAMTLHR